VASALLKNFWRHPSGNDLENAPVDIDQFMRVKKRFHAGPYFLKEGMEFRTPQVADA
jgi:hypothetical protein